MNEQILIFNEINIAPLIKAHKTLQDGLKQAHDQLTRDGVIQRFEYTFELTWKTLKKILKYKGIDLNTPRDVFRDSAKIGLINDPLLWFNFLEKRNETSHVYSEKTAKKIYEEIPVFAAELEKLINTIRTL